MQCAAAQPCFPRHGALERASQLPSRPRRHSSGNQRADHHHSAHRGAGQAALAAGHTRAPRPRLRSCVEQSPAFARSAGLTIDPDASDYARWPGAFCWLPACWWILATLAAGDRLPCNRHFLRLVEGRATGAGRPGGSLSADPELVERYWDRDSVGALVASPIRPTLLIARSWQAGGAESWRPPVPMRLPRLTYSVDAASVESRRRRLRAQQLPNISATGWRLGCWWPHRLRFQVEKLAQNLYISARAWLGTRPWRVSSRRRGTRARRGSSPSAVISLPALRAWLQYRGRAAGRVLSVRISAFGGDAYAFCQHIQSRFVAILSLVRSFQVGHNNAFRLHPGPPRLESYQRGLRSWQSDAFCATAGRGDWSGATSVFLPISSPTGRSVHPAPTPARCSIAWARCAVWFSAAAIHGANCRGPGSWSKPWGRLACVNRHGPIRWSRGAAEWADCRTGRFPTLKREVAYGVENSRGFSSRLRRTAAFVEVKSVTSALETRWRPSDAVTTRGARHRELSAGPCRCAWCSNTASAERHRSGRPARRSIRPMPLRCGKRRQAWKYWLTASIFPSRLRITGRLPVLL